MKQVELAKQHLNALRELGVKVAVDDFGTGYSSLGYLSEFAVNSLKIDRSFVRRLEENRTNRAIIRSVLALGRNLELDVVAEGVESTTELNFLQEHDCRFVQGYYFAKPMSEASLLDWFAETPLEKAKELQSI